MTMAMAFINIYLCQKFFFLGRMVLNNSLGDPFGDKGMNLWAATVYFIHALTYVLLIPKLLKYVYLFIYLFKCGGKKSLWPWKIQALSQIYIYCACSFFCALLNQYKQAEMFLPERLIHAWFSVQMEDTKQKTKFQLLCKNDSYFITITRQNYVNGK